MLEYGYEGPVRLQLLWVRVAETEPRGVLTGWRMRHVLDACEVSIGEIGKPEWSRFVGTLVSLGFVDVYSSPPEHDHSGGERSEYRDRDPDELSEELVHLDGQITYVLHNWPTRQPMVWDWPTRSEINRKNALKRWRKDKPGKPDRAGAACESHCAKGESAMPHPSNHPDKTKRGQSKSSGTPPERGKRTGGGDGQERNAQDPQKGRGGGIVIPCIDGVLLITREQIDGLQAHRPEVAVEDALARMAAHFESNPKRRLIKRNMPRRIEQWINEDSKAVEGQARLKGIINDLIGSKI